MSQDQQESETATKPLLSQEDKCFLDDLPDVVVERIFSVSDSDIVLTHIPSDMSGVTSMHFHGDKALAARAYLAMLMNYGIRKDIRHG